MSSDLPDDTLAQITEVIKSNGENASDPDGSNLWRMSGEYPIEQNARDGNNGGPSRNRTGVNGFAVRCVTTPPSGLDARRIEIRRVEAGG